MGGQVPLHNNEQEEQHNIIQLASNKIHELSIRLRSMQICFLKFIARRIKDDSLKQKKKEFPIAHNVTIVHLILCIILTAQRT